MVSPRNCNKMVSICGHNEIRICEDILQFEIRICEDILHKYFLILQIYKRRVSSYKFILNVFMQT